MAVVPYSDNRILQLTFQFALKVIEFCADLERCGKFLLGRQLFRSGTSIGAMVRESQGAESRADFIHKMKIAYKEAHETIYWLSLCKGSTNYPNPANLIKDVEEILKILGKIIISSIANAK